MEGTDADKLAKRYQSDIEETEDEEVKRNCIMGQSGLRDSDFSDSDLDEEEEVEEKEKKTVDADADDRNQKVEAGEISKEDEMADLVKFVTIGSQIMKPNGVVLYRPTPVLPHSTLQSNITDTKVVTMKGSEVSSDDGSDADIESDDSDDETKLPPHDFPFTDREGLSGLEVVEGASIIAQDTEEGCCEPAFDEDQHEEMSEIYALVGASGASVDDKWETAKQKRVLSSNTLSALNAEANHDEDCMKRRRGLEISFKDAVSIPEITLGVEALSQIIQPLPRQYIIRDDSPSMASCNDKDEDEMLSEELEETFQDNGAVCNGDHSIIPLLTPPQSPRTVDNTFESQAMVAIEWPSNLVMDTAIITACANTSQSSTSSRNDENLMNDTPKAPTFTQSSTTNSKTRLRTISVAL
mmetsp:Transcript_13385/g.37700  ORF Transcript_13385/g.37700 Transcript_13385/m.37700 type:complete len:411 (+) Transcript_13385:363-1595(+)|eukprot:CAMPEP_0172378862 /NCGR_PEP_ID=MMETSP1060-20121228/69635_1 /TAXON_ID=37318 /ORGANISM="Pseudo-nitzschia pungens, Strain cf. cingulata" /LENGTH=410 /DNA_ID=CAMNT_0013106589 /DNA_START=1054 /DNA_END=2286 /DNA_ORIENTATION=-